MEPAVSDEHIRPEDDDVEAHRIKLIRESGDDEASEDDTEGHRIKLIRGDSDDEGGASGN